MMDHTLEYVLIGLMTPQTVLQLEPFLEMNRSTNQSHVAIKKIMKYHLNIDISPMFEWDLEGERNLKAVRYMWLGLKEPESCCKK